MKAAPNNTAHGTLLFSQMVPKREQGEAPRPLQTTSSCDRNTVRLTFGYNYRTPDRYRVQVTIGCKQIIERKLIIEC